MRIFDTNLLIYSAADDFAYLRAVIQSDTTFFSAVSKLETLGYSRLSFDEREYFEEIFSTVTVLPISESVIDKAVELRQQKKMSVGDCIIAATALLYGFDLYTNNTKDFVHIPGLTIVNPLEDS